MKRTIGELLAAAQARKDLTDVETAAVLRVSQPTVTRWRTGRNLPRPEHVSRIARFIGITPTEVETAIGATVGRPMLRSKGETLPDLLIEYETDHGLDAAGAWRQLGIDKSRYYRLRSGAGVPIPTEIPALAKALRIDDERVALAVYRTELARARITSPLARSRVHAPT